MEITQLTFFPRHTRITVRFRNHLYSSQVAGLTDGLLAVLPHLAEHRCHNRHDLPFAEELNDSELGHVFEHVVLALLTRHGIFTRGQTTWNWQRDPIGTYHVTVATGKRLAVKECLLTAQAILTNLLVGPILRFEPIPGGDGRAVPLTISPKGREPERLLFSTGHEKTDPAETGLVG